MIGCVKVAAIVAMDDQRVIGKQGALPWHLPEDLAHFRKLTSGNPVVMGRKTWDSLPTKFKPLPGRSNIVISRDGSDLVLPDGVLRALSPVGAIEIARGVATEGSTIWIIGGAEIYKATLPLCDEVHLTKVHGVHEGDAWLPPFEDGYALTSETAGERCTFQVYSRVSTGSQPKE
jgi:dihydrofolate reductase